MIRNSHTCFLFFTPTALHLAVVGKNDMIRNMRRQRGADPSTERSLNRRNLDVAVQEWARMHCQNKNNAQVIELSKYRHGDVPRVCRISLNSAQFI